MLKLIELAMTAITASSGASSGSAMSWTWSALRGSLSADSRPFEHVLLGLEHHHGPVGLGQRQRGHVVGGGSGLDGVDDVVQLVRHGRKLPPPSGTGTKGGTVDEIGEAPFRSRSVVG